MLGSKQVLIITYYWPPSGGAGVQRWLRFARLLPEFGWDPIILTVDPENAAFPARDPELGNDLPDSIKVHYIKGPNTIFSLYNKLSGSESSPSGGFASKSASPFQKIMRFIRGNFYIPDARKSWAKRATKKALELVETYKIDTVITSSPPHSSQLIGLKIKMSDASINWFADLRDPWTDIFYSDKLYQTSFARKANLRMESKVLNTADKVLVTCNSTRTLFQSRLEPEQARDKVITITNGYDENDFLVGDIKVADGFVITYMGSFTDSYNINVLLRALKQLKESDSSKVILRFVGNIDKKVLEPIVKSSGIKVESTGYVPHSRVIKYLLESSALLLVVPAKNKAEEMIPGKLFEYLAAGKPIIATGPGSSEVGEILNKTGRGRIFDEDDEDDLIKYLLDLIYPADLDDIASNKDIQQYSIRKLTADLSTCLNK